jgi:hypothetical protein
MLPTEIVYFTVLMFLALAALIKWKHRRDETAAKLRRGLCGYVAASRTARVPVQPPVSEPKDAEQQSLITA